MEDSLKKELQALAAAGGRAVRFTPSGQVHTDWMDLWGIHYQLDATAKLVTLLLAGKYSFSWQPSAQTVMLQVGYNRLVFTKISSFAALCQPYIGHLRRDPERVVGSRIFVPKSYEAKLRFGEEFRGFTKLYTYLDPQLATEFELVRATGDERSGEPYKWYNAERNESVTFLFNGAGEEADGPVIRVDMKRQRDKLSVPIVLTLRIKRNRETGAYYGVREWTRPGEMQLHTERDPDFDDDTVLSEYVMKALRSFFTEPEFALNSCVSCLAAEARLRCTECKIAHYCSQSCGNAHLPLHGEFCAEFKKH